MRKLGRVLPYLKLMCLGVVGVLSLTPSAARGSAPETLRAQNLQAESIQVIDASGRTISDWGKNARGGATIGGPGTTIEAGTITIVGPDGRPLATLSLTHSGDPYLEMRTAEVSSTAAPDVRVQPGLIRLSHDGAPDYISLSVGPQKGRHGKRQTGENPGAVLLMTGRLRIEEGFGESGVDLGSAGEVEIWKGKKSRSLLPGD